MDAVILAAGKGSRLKRKDDHLPKIFIELGGRPLYYWQLSALDDYCDRIIFMLGHGFEEHSVPRNEFNIPDDIDASIEFQVLSDWSDYENGYTAKRALEEVEDHVLLVCGDVIFSEEPIQRIMSKFEAECESDGENIVGAVQGIQDEMTAVQVSPEGYVSEYGAIRGHQEVGLFLLHQSNISKSIPVLRDNYNYWFPIIFEKTPSRISFTSENNSHEINNRDHLQEAQKNYRKLPQL